MNQMKIIIVVGLPGTGKTTFASTLANTLGTKHLNSDIVRDSFGKRGHYDVSSKAAVYNEMLTRTEEYLKNRQSIIVDATFYKEVLRVPYVRLGEKYEVPVEWIELRANEDEIRTRVSKKRKYSEADFEVYLKIKEHYEPLNYNHLVLWSDQLSTEEMIYKANNYLKAQTSYKL